MKKNCVAIGVRVKLNENFKEKCLGDKYLKDEPVLFIESGHIFNDSKGDYVFIKGGSLTNSGYAYLNEIDGVFTRPENPLYDLYPDENLNESTGIIEPKVFTETFSESQVKKALSLYWISLQAETPDVLELDKWLENNIKQIIK